MAYPTGFTTVVDGVTEILATHINQLETKVGIDTDTNPLSLDYRVTYLENNAALLPGRAGGQTLKGGTGSAENLTLQSTAHATKGVVKSLDDFKADKHAAFGGSGAINSLRVVDVAESVVPTGNNQAYRGISSALTVTPSGDFTGIWIGLRSDLTIAGAGNYVGGPTTAHNLLTTTYSGTGSLDYAFGLTTRSTKSGSGAIAIVLGGAQASFSTSGGGTTAAAQAFRVQGGPVGDAITDAYGIYVRDIRIDGGGGSITNLYGLYLEPQTEATTLNYNLYSAGATTKNYFGGSVGIGTASPDTAFHVVGSIKMVDGAQGLGKVMVSDANGVGAWVAPGLIPAGGWTDDGTVVRLTTSTDQVSIGTATPWAGSHFQVTSPTGTYIVGGYSAARALGNSVHFFAMDSIPQHIGDLAFKSNNGTNNASTFSISVGNGSGGALQALTILTSGNVGIGNASPGAKLHIQGSGSGNMRLGEYASDNSYSAISLNGVDLSNSNLNFLSKNADHLWISRQTGKQIKFSESMGTAQMVIDTGGNVGIGTTTPNNKLQVAGLISFDNTLQSTCLGNGAGAAISSGVQNVTVGYNALASCSTASYNTAIGRTALYSSNSAANTAVGYAAMWATTGSENVAVGASAMQGATTGSENVAIGQYSLDATLTGGRNVGVGKSTLSELLSGTENIAVGYQAGCFITGGSVANATGSHGVFLGTRTYALADGDTNEIVIGSTNTGLGSNTVLLGNSSIVTTALRGNVGIGTTSPGAKLDVNGSAKVGTLLYFGAETDNGNGGVSKTIDWSINNHNKITLNSATCTLTFTAPSGPCILYLKVVQDVTGSRTITWPTIKWVGSSPPTLTASGNAIDLIGFYYDGTSYYGMSNLNFA